MNYRDMIEFTIQKYYRMFISDTLDNIPKDSYLELCISKFESLNKIDRIEIISNIFQRFLIDYSANIDDLEKILCDFSKIDIYEQLYMYYLLDVQEDLEDYHIDPRSLRND